VKGLDFALLEQNKARSLNSADDDESLEKAFLATSKGAPSTVPKKRTREGIIRELKEKRGSKPTEDSSMSKTAEQESRLLEEVKQKGKFKPIGFKPIGDGDIKKKKKKVETERKDGERKKKKRKVEDASKDVNGTAVDASGKGSMLPPPVPSKALETLPPAVSEPDSLDEDFNIFADVGEYEGIGLESDDDDNPKKSSDVDTPQEAEVPNIHRQWIGTNDPESTPSVNPPESLQKDPTEPSTSHSLPPEGEEEEEQPTRLVPLASSALPSIKEFLAMEKAAGSYGKRKKGKDKKKSGGMNEDGAGEKSKKLNAEAKAERDYKRSVTFSLFSALTSDTQSRLKSYTDKKADASAAK
jgi:IK cytokine